MNQFCSCTQDGYCPRYQRDMSGRFRQICQGINCDLGTAAAFRLQWLSEVTPQPSTQPPIPLLLKTNQCPGDCVAMTAAIYSLHKAHPGKYRTYVQSNYPEVFQYNPDVYNAGPNSYGESVLTAQPLEMHYPAIHDSNKRGIHFMQAYCEFLGFALNESVPLLTNRPHIYFPQEEHQQGDYWLICSGGKTDFTNKLWSKSRYQEVVNRLPQINFIQVGDNTTLHQPLNYGHYMVGETTIRQLFDLVRCCRGVVCGVSLLMHVAAALCKPAIIVAGGREPVQWNAYPKQHYLHTVGMLPCSSPQGEIGGGCWRSRVVPLGDNETLDKHPCLFPQGNTPKCMSLIEPSQVADLILKLDRQYND